MTRNAFNLAMTLLLVGVTVARSEQATFQSATVNAARGRYEQAIRRADNERQMRIQRAARPYLMYLGKARDAAGKRGDKTEQAKLAREIRRVSQQAKLDPGGATRRSGPTLKTRYGELEIFPPDNPWNQDISKRPVDPRSDQYIASMGRGKPLHPVFGTEWQGIPLGIPFMVVSGNHRKIPVKFTYAGESDRGPYPIPLNPKIEGERDKFADRHLIVLDYHNKKLYELFYVFYRQGGWQAGSGAIFDLTSNKQRPAGWTSSCASGLPVFPGLVRYDEVVEKKRIRHALRFTATKTQRAYVYPATHHASKYRNRDLPPMGLRLRLKAGYDISGFPHEARVILKALKTYGMILSDNGADWFITGAPDPRWNDEALHTLRRVRGRDFEAVQTGKLVTE